MDNLPSGRTPSLFERFGIVMRRDIFKKLNRGMLLMWRLGLGPFMNLGPPTMGRLMVLGTRGRKSGLWRWTPLNFALSEGHVYCVAGFGPTTDWYKNLERDPKVELWLPFGAWRGEATTVEDPEERLQRLRQALIASGFAAPLLGGIHPRLISDADLEREAADYKVVRVRLVEPSSRHIADLGWVWPVLGGVFGGLLLLLAAWMRMA